LKKYSLDNPLIKHYGSKKEINKTKIRLKKASKKAKKGHKKEESRFKEKIYFS